MTKSLAHVTPTDLAHRWGSPRGKSAGCCGHSMARSNGRTGDPVGTSHWPRLRSLGRRRSGAGGARATLRRAPGVIGNEGAGLDFRPRLGARERERETNREGTRGIRRITLLIIDVLRNSEKR